MRVSRRRFLRLVAGGAAWWLTSLQRAVASPYRVGAGHSADPYAATLRAVQASAEWPTPRIAGGTIVIKPNLVQGMPADTGVTTDPEVVRALVDVALEADPRRIFIVESGVRGANFSACGYDFLDSYDPQARVSLVDLRGWPSRLCWVPEGMAYNLLYMPTPLMGPDVVFISVAKLKCHVQSLVTLSMKNLFGLPPWRYYRLPFPPGRFAMHRRGVHQTVVDLNLVRPIDFAVVDGIWAMEGDGPWNGEAVKMDVVLVGRNALAVDRACLAAMGIPQDRVQHLTYAAAKGLGPSDMTTVQIQGDPLPSRDFAQPETPPLVDVPECTPQVFSPHKGQQTNISYHVDRPCQTQVEIVRTWEIGPWVRPVRTLHDWMERPAGSETLTWDGRDDEGNLVSPGRYTVRVRANAGQRPDDASQDPPYGTGPDAYATGWIWVRQPTVYLPIVMTGAGER